MIKKPFISLRLFIILVDVYKRQMYDVTGSLCENNDKFAIDRMLPHIDMGDLLVIHDSGAHGYSCLLYTSRCV